MGKSRKSIEDKDLIFWRFFFFLSIIVVLGNILDSITTYFALKIQGTYESNPLMGHIINNWGWFAFFAVKTLFVYLPLPLKYCPLYYPINFGIRGIKDKAHIKAQIIGMLIMVGMLTLYLFLAYGFLKMSLGNLQHIL